LGRIRIGYTALPTKKEVGKRRPCSLGQKRIEVTYQSFLEDTSGYLQIVVVGRHYFKRSPRGRDKARNQGGEGGKEGSRRTICLGKRGSRRQRDTTRDDDFRASWAGHGCGPPKKKTFWETRDLWDVLEDSPSKVTNYR